MALSSPSVGALGQLHKLYEDYAAAHGLRYNAGKRELLVFRTGTKCYANIPNVTICITLLMRVTRYKYLVH